MTIFFDSHAHLTSSQVLPHLDAIVQRAQDAGVVKIANICTDETSLVEGMRLSQQYDFIVNTAATTPHDVEKEGEQFFSVVEACAKEGGLAAIGESGLDYFYEHSPKSTQKRFLVKYFHLALQTRLPIVIHCREAFADFFDILDQEYMAGGALAPGVLHCFTGTVDEAKGVIDRGWMLSLSGIVTFKKSAVLQEVAKMVPLECLLLETDTPYLAPQTKRGKPNEPAYLPEIAQMVAALKKLPVEEIARATYWNACRFFRLDERYSIDQPPLGECSLA